MPYVSYVFWKSYKQRLDSWLMWRIIVIIVDINIVFFYRLWSFVVQQDLVILEEVSSILL